MSAPPNPLGLRRRDQRGLAAIMVALSVTSLVIASAMVLDFGLVRVDRQVNKSAADAAVLSGLTGLAGSDTDTYPYKGVCTAIRVLQQNGARFASVTDDTGTWTDGAGAATGNGCTSATYRAATCVAGTPSSWARFTWTGSYQGEPFRVVVSGGYQLSGSGYAEEQLAAAVADSNDGVQGCDQLAVVVTQNRKPGLGSLAQSADLVSTVRSVGRVSSKAAGDSPAMLLLKRTGCPVLTTGSSGGGSYIHVYGAISSAGVTQPGSIHADTDGTGCGGSAFTGKSPDGIVAYAAPLASNPAQPDPSRPGMVTTVAGFNGVGLGTVRDAAGNVYGSAARFEAGAAAAAKTEPTGRPLVTRAIVDARYLGLESTPATDGVKKAVRDAQNNVFAVLTGPSQALAQGYKVVSGCSPSAADLAGITAADRVYVDCTANGGFTGTAPVVARTVVFAGSVKPPNSGAGTQLPNADHVYVFGAAGGDAIALSNGAVLGVHTAGNTTGSPARCSGLQSSSKAIVFLRSGGIKQTGGSLQLCYTTVIAMGGQSNACLPTYTLPTTTAGLAAVPAPTTTPCGGDYGDGQISQTGGDVDWTAPNQYDLMTLPNGDPDPAKQTAWRDVNGPEDLAFWSESAGNSSNHTYNLAGGGTLHTVGVYMVPNADSFTISGGAHQDLVNAQYVVTSILLNGNNTSITMQVDANSALQLPRLRSVGLVR